MTRFLLILAALLVGAATISACSSVTDPFDGCREITLSYSGSTWEAEESQCRGIGGTVKRDGTTRYCCR